MNYLDAAFRNVRNLGIVSVTSTDTGSLYSKSPNVTLRHYGCQIVRTEYYRELAARMVVASIARYACVASGLQLVLYLIPFCKNLMLRGVCVCVGFQGSRTL